MTIEFLYVGDPMCSWCWGFSPVIESLARHYSVPVKVKPGGLRPGPEAQLLDDGLRTYLRGHWEQVASRSGQPFDVRALERQGWTYDTELPCTAVTVMNRMDESQALAWFGRLQRAFYAQAIDITTPDVYPELLTDFDVDGDHFMAQLMSDEARMQAWEDIEHTRSLGINGFPSLLITMPEGYTVVTRGYVPWDRLEPALTSWLTETVGEERMGTLLTGEG